MAELKNYFKELNEINVNDKVEKKNGLTYLSWAYAWGELKKRHPDASYTVYENTDGWNYFTDGHTCWVKTGVTVNGLEHIEYLPVMDFKNKSIPLGNITSFEVNKTIQRSLTKAVARHGLGLYIYAGEDLPDESDGTQAVKKASPKKTAPKTEEPVFEVEDINYRAELRDYLKKVGIDPNVIIQACGLKPDSSNKEWAEALDYAKSMVGDAL